MIDRKEWTEHVAEKANTKARESRPGLEMLQQAAVKSSSLTGNPAWDTFLSYLQAAVDTTKLQRDAFQDKLTDPDLVNTEEMLRLKSNITRCSERIIAWETAISLPKDIIAEGEKAKSLLGRLEKEDAA